MPIGAADLSRFEFTKLANPFFPLPRKFDAEDPRFSAIYESPLYNIDPSNPKFKRTKAMTEVIQKKIRKH